MLTPESTAILFIRLLLGVRFSVYKKCYAIEGNQK